MERVSEKRNGENVIILRKNKGNWSIASRCDSYCIFGDAADRLAAYEDTGLEPGEIRGLCSMDSRAKMADLLRLEEYQELGSIDRLRELVQAERDGRLAVLPFIAMIEQSLRDGSMKPYRDQCFNGRYAVVYLDKKKWASPLIDICGQPYDRGQAEERLAELPHEEAEAALKGVPEESTDVVEA